MSLIGIAFQGFALATGTDPPSTLIRNTGFLSVDAVVAVLVWWAARTPRLGDAPVLALAWSWRSCSA